MLKKLRPLCFVLLCSISLAAVAQQQTAIVKGRLINAATKEPATEVQLTFPLLNLLTTSNGQGDFNFSQVPYGTHQMVVGGQSTHTDTLSVKVESPVVDLNEIYVRLNEANTSVQTFDIPTIAIEENTSNSDDDAGTSAQSVSGLLTGSRDPFINTSAFIFGPYRFRPRGVERNAQEVFVNGIPMNDVETGDAYWSQWGGLNDVFRSRVNTFGLAPADHGYGSINGLTSFDATAANQRKQTRITYSRTNRSYRNRLMVTHSSGLNQNGWAYSVSLGRRWAQEGYFDGTYYDGYSYYGAVSKRLKGGKHLFHFTTFGAPTERGKMNAVYDESVDLYGSTKYNPNWGYQNGEKRNSRVANFFQPTSILSYEYHPNNDLRWSTAVAYQFGKNGDARIDWYNGSDIRPDYYKYLPSYYTLSFNNNPKAVEEMRAYYRSNPDNMQVQWDKIYQANYMNYEAMPGTGEVGRRSVYVMGSDIDDIKKYSFNTNIEYMANEHIKLYTGLNYINQRTESYRELVDLLGGDYFLNLNQFAEREFSGQNTLLRNNTEDENVVVKEGDKYSYDYIMHYNKAWWWGQAMFTYNKVDFFVAARAGMNSFVREGVYRNGLYPDNSFGKAASQNFFTYGVKGGVTYKLNGRNYFFVNANYSTDAPPPEQTYVSLRNRDITVANPTVQKTQTVEGGYLMKAPSLNIRAVGYATDIKDAIELKRYYYDNFNSFVSYAMTGVNMRMIGTELAVDVKVSPSVNVTGVAAIGQAFYTNRPQATIYQDNDTLVDGVTETPYIKDYYLGVGPQSAYSLGVNYRSPRYWYANLNFNYFDRNYLDVAPNRRTINAIGLTEPESQKWHDILDQEKLPSFFTVDLFFGKSFKLNKIIKSMPNNAFLYLNVGVNNLLDNQNIKTGGFEQLRFDYTDSDKFPNKYFYGFGRNYFINLSLKF
jgi:hypothetical protein